MTDETIVGAVGYGVTYNGRPARVTEMSDLSAARVLASRSEVKRGEWERFENDVCVVPTGSVAYKLGLVAAGRADATWTLVPKHEWDIAAGVALVLAAGGAVQTIDGTALRFNHKPVPRLSGLVATGPGLIAPVGHLLSIEQAVAE
jgi:myo-inositol-1(or 4)-monophosphatase